MTAVDKPHITLRNRINVRVCMGTQQTYVTSTVQNMENKWNNNDLLVPFCVLR